MPTTNPPNYQANSPRPLTISEQLPTLYNLLARKFGRETLLVMSLVDKSISQACRAELWKDPVATAVTCQRPFSSVYQLIVNANRARQNTRNMVQSLDFRPLVSLQANPRHLADYRRRESVMSTAWVFRHILLFKHLQFISLDGMRADEEEHRLGGNLLLPSDDPSLRVVSVAHCKSLDTTSLLVSSDLLIENLWYLDLSYTSGSEQLPGILRNAPFRNLRVLKLRGLRLTTGQLPYDLIRFERQLWCLDVRDNLLTNEAIPSIIQSGIAPRIYPNLHEFDHETDSILFEDPPMYAEFIHNIPTTNTCPIRPDSFEGFVRYLKTHANLPNDREDILQPGDRLAQQTGLTHLYLSGNKITSHGVKLLMLEANRLQVLDVGSPRMETPHCVTRNIPFGVVDIPRFLRWTSGTRIEELTIHHSVVTGLPTMVRSTPSKGWSYSALWEAEMIFIPLGTVVSQFYPQMNYCLSSLTLTDVPTKSYGPILGCLKEFVLRLANQEAELSGAQAKMAPHPLTPRLLSGLRTLRLVLSPEETAIASDLVGPSVSGHRDADNFLSESRGDFSFFAGGAPGGSSRSLPVSSDALPPGTVYDIVEELKRYRSDPEVPRWGGKLELMRALRSE